MTAILQITDTHIVAEGVLVSGKLDTRGCVKATGIASLLNPKIRSAQLMRFW